MVAHAIFETQWPPVFFGYPELPVGAVTAFAGLLGAPVPAMASPPVSSISQSPYITNPIEAWGWMLCDGRALAVERYPELFTVLGYRYGGSDDTFQIPDYRGYFLRGAADGSDVDPDAAERTPAQGGSPEEVGSTQLDALQCHRHSYTQPDGSAFAGDKGNAVLQALPNQCTGYPDDAACNDNVKTSQHETRPVNIAVNYIIKFTYGP
jgi:microcystin-dependent protein